MNILITGGTGFVGQKLCRTLKDYQLTILTRNKSSVKTAGNISVITSLKDYTHFNDFDAIINLAGEPIFSGRWTKAKKDSIFSSRIELTEQLVTRINNSTQPPHTFISASAAGIYGDAKNLCLSEEHVKHNTSFTHYVCSHWEDAALKAQTRVCLLRSGIILGEKGALPKMLPMFRLGLGAALGNGRQFMPWIHIDDEVRAIVFLLERSTLNGAFNLCSPNTVTNKEFSRTLAKTLNKRLYFSIPQFVMQTCFGEASHLLLDSQRMLPVKLNKAGFSFNYANLDIALGDIIKHID